MARTTLLVFAIVQLVCLTVDINAQSKNAFFRKDYQFLEATQSFYKIHTIHRSWRDAKKRCTMEGGYLFYPDDQIEADAVIGFWNQTQPFYWVYIGVSDFLAKGVFETVDGRPVTDVYSVWGPGEPNDVNGVEDCVILRRDGTINDDACDKKYPFICKKTLLSLEWNFLCDMPDKSYLYDNTLGKCYKFHLTPMNWTDAYSVCAAEQSYLAVINSQKEADHLVKTTNEAPRDTIKGDYLRGAVHLGFHNRDDDGWKTVRGTTLEESGYTRWGNQQPDGGDKEQCGTMFYTGTLNDLACWQKCFFICEHDIGTLNSAIDERFGT
ncbi:uncharacterized protein LOC105394158 isoform X1 [Plutella xylostella]|uniref:uncharacterized protein LOC105394158 isoform X1 n=2 Tax=Plutella xylostella TaxID=51655 RepID=UPI002032773B|nr:uncharacterized protein LOC105394158 isoform X1 [Plutella xylostella]